MYWQSGKTRLNSNSSSTCPHNVANFGPLTAEISSGVWGTSANFNGFRVLPSLLQWRRSPEANQTLHDVWPSPIGWYTIYAFLGALAPWRNFARWNIHFSSKSCVLVCWQRYCTALQQRASVKLCGVVQGMELRNFLRAHHLYSAGPPSRWASAHILVVSVVITYTIQYLIVWRLFRSLCDNLMLWIFNIVLNRRKLHNEKYETDSSKLSLSLVTLPNSTSMVDELIWEKL